jgi:hypothetical protein
MMEILLGIVIGMALTFLIAYLYIRGLVRQVMAELDEKFEQAKSTLMPVTVERMNGVIFCYSKEDNQFICQGTTLTEVKEAFKARFPDKTAFIAGGEESLVEELRKELKQSV